MPKDLKTTTNKNKKTTKKLSNPAAVIAAKKAVPEVKEGAKQVNKDTKGALSWVIVGGVTIASILVLKTISNASKVTDVVGSGADLASSALEEAKKQLTDPNYNSSDAPILTNGEEILTISDIEAKNRANMLLDAMDGFGTDFPMVKTALANITAADFVLIAEHFGTPRYDGAGEGMWPASKRNLSYWIVAELDNEELEEIRALVPNLF